MRRVFLLGFDLYFRAQLPAGAPTYADIVNLGRLSAVVAVKLKELRRSMFWIGQSRWVACERFGLLSHKQQLQVLGVGQGRL